MVIVLDRSGSMGMEGTVEGMTKMEEAQAAAALFVQLVESEADHRAALVSFSTSATSDYELHPVDEAVKTALTGPFPHTEGFIGGLETGGTTSIGHGIQIAQERLPAPSADANRPHIFLLTDGLENTPPMIDEVESRLGEIRLCIVGFGSEASLNGPLLARLAREHDGRYTRAETGLELQKFFVLCFGNIFESGSSLDPEGRLGAGEDSAKPLPLDVCGEESLTVVAGWDEPSAELAVELETPDGNPIQASTAGAIARSGTTWTFIRLVLPFNGEGDGRWLIHVKRTGGSVEFPPPEIDVDYYVSTVVKGGPYLRSVMDTKALYTGDVLNPRVLFQKPSGAIPAHANVEVTITAPTEGAGNLLSKHGLGGTTVVDGDRLDARVSTLLALKKEQEKPLIPTTAHTYQLLDDGTHDDGAMEPDGIFGNPLGDFTRHEGNYTIHVRASYGEECKTVRETTWSVHVDLGIDHDNSEIDATPTGELPDGRDGYRVTIIPKDRYGNRIGPGRLNGFVMHPQPGSEFTTPVRDRGNGSYEVDIAWDSDAGVPPGIVLDQPDRPPFALCDIVKGGVEKPCAIRWWIYWIIALLLILVFVLLLIVLFS